MTTANPNAASSLPFRRLPLQCRMPSRPSRTAVLFDLDGTLLDSLGDLAESMNAVLRERGLPTHDLDAFRYFIGDGIRELVKRSLPESIRGDETALLAFLDDYRASYEARWHLSKPFDGVPELLDALQDRAVDLGVVSNKPDPFTQKCVERLFPNWSWRGIAGQREGIPRKPDPTSALTLAEEMGLAPERCWFVGDSDVDMQTGVNAGMRAVGVTWGFRTEEELRGAGAEHIIHSPGELLNLVDDLQSTP